MSSLLEATMLICFGLSWPINTMKAYKARSAKSMSLPFILMIITGYVAGISAKLLNHQTNYVLAVYILNLAVVSLNLVVYFRNKKLDQGDKRSVVGHVEKVCAQNENKENRDIVSAPVFFITSGYIKLYKTGYYYMFSFGV